MNKEKEITEKEYVLTNINLDGYFVIRLTDGKAYKVYRGHKGNRSYEYIVKDGKEIPLSEKVRNYYHGSVREYQREGI